VLVGPFTLLIVHQPLINPFKFVQALQSSTWSVLDGLIHEAIGLQVEEMHDEGVQLKLLQTVLAMLQSSIHAHLEVPPIV
jgi:hypothetical protein